MPSAKIACPHCQRAMALPAGMEGMTVACPHCKKPFQLPGAAGADVPDFGGQIPEGPKRRSAGRSPAPNPWLWLFIIAPFVGVLIVVLILSKGSGGNTELNKARLRAEYDEIKTGMTAEEAEKRVRKVLADFPGEIEKSESNDEDGNMVLEFSKGDVKVVLKIHPTTNKVFRKNKVGF